MSAIVMGILNALIGLLMQVLASALECFSDMFFTTIHFDFTTFGRYIPFFSHIMHFIQTLSAGWLSIVGLLFILKCFGLAAGLQIQRSKIWNFVIRFLLFGFTAINGWALMSFFYNGLVTTIDDVFLMDAKTPISFAGFINSLGERAADGLFVSLTGNAGAMLGIVKVLIMLVIAVMLVVNFFKLISMFFIRYVRLIFLVALAPLTIGMAILDETREIFETYIRVFFADLFVFIMTAFFIKGFISVMSAASGFDTAVEFNDIAYDGIFWGFFALAYSAFAVQFDQFISSLGVHISRGGNAGNGILGAVGMSAMLLRRAVGTGRNGSGLATSLGNTFDRNWNGLKSSIMQGARQGFASADTVGGAVFSGAAGAIKGFAATTNVAKAAAMTKDGSFTASALNQKFSDMQDAARRNMSPKEYQDTKKRAEENGLSIDQQRSRDVILQDMKNGSITPQMAQNKLAARGLLTEEEMTPSTMQSQNVEGYSEQHGEQQASSMAEQEMQQGNSPDLSHIQMDSTIETAEGIKVNPQEHTLETADGMDYNENGKFFADGTKITEQGVATFANGSVFNPVNGMMKHRDGTVTKGNTIIYPDGTKETVAAPTDLSDGTTVYPDGHREIQNGTNRERISISDTGDITHGNGTKTVDGITHHANGIVSQVNGSVTTARGVVNPDGSVTAPNGITTIPDGSAVYPDGSVWHSNGDITANGITKHTDGTTSHGDKTEHENGSISFTDGSVQNPDGTVIDGKGNISFDNGMKFTPISTSYSHANGDVSFADGRVLHRDGSISNDNGKIGSLTHKDGVISLADNSLLYPNAIVMNNRVEFDCGAVLEKDGTLSHLNGDQVITQNHTTTIKHKDGTQTEFFHSADRKKANGKERIGRIRFKNGRIKSIRK